MGKAKTDQIPTYRLGLDLGGTKIHAVIINKKGKVLASSRRSTKAEDGYKAVLKRLQTTVKEVIEFAKVNKKEFPSIGLGMPGPIDEEKGMVRIAPNLGWEKKMVSKDLQKLIGHRVVLGNDVNYGALGEAVYGSAAGATSAYAAFVGTGLGGGYILKGQLVNGKHGFAGEIGHIPAPFGDSICKCGLKGCLETLASKTGIIRLIQNEVKNGTKCFLELKKNKKPKSSQIRNAYLGGCPATKRALQTSCQSLAWGLSSVTSVIDPDVFVLGGGIMEALGKELIPLICNNFSKYSLIYRHHLPDIRLAALGDDAVAIGAAVASTEPPGVVHG